MLIIDDVQIIINSVYERELREEILEKALFLLTCIKGTIPNNVVPLAGTWIEIQWPRKAIFCPAEIKNGTVVRLIG